MSLLLKYPWCLWQLNMKYASKICMVSMATLHRLLPDSALQSLSPGVIEVMSSVKMCYTSGYLNFLVQQITLLWRFCVMVYCNTM